MWSRGEVKTAILFQNQKVLKQVVFARMFVIFLFLNLFLFKLLLDPSDLFEFL